MSWANPQFVIHSPGASRVMELASVPPTHTEFGRGISPRVHARDHCPVAPAMEVRTAVEHSSSSRIASRHSLSRLTHLDGVSECMRPVEPYPGILATISAIFSVSVRPWACYGCPPSCIVCSENATICQGLTYIPAVPLTTRALLLTDGTIPSVDKPSLDSLSFLTLLKLSNNGIVDIKEDAFHGLSDLRILLLDQNQITDEAITESTFTGLSNLEILQLGNNAISQINGTWFRNMVSLGSLDLGRNQITKLEADIFSVSSLQNLQILDLSHNSIDYVHRDAFRGLRGLRRLDLSGNSLSGMADSFSYLSKLSVLNLDLNRWNCTCRLKELAVFLRNFIKSPDRTLTNSRDLVCEAAETLKVQTVLQLADSNCVTPSQNAPIILTSGSYRRYVRDVILAAIFCFAGAVGLTVAVVTLLHNKRPQRMEQREKNCQLSGAGPNRERDSIPERVPRCHFTHHSEVEATSAASSVNRPTLSPQGAVSPKSGASNKQRLDARSAGLLSQAKDEAAENDYFACDRCRLVHTFRTPADDETRRLAGKFSAGTTETREDEGGMSWGTKGKLPQQVKASAEGSAEGSRATNEHSGNLYCLSKEPMGIYNPGKGYFKWVAEAKDVRRGQAIAQLKSQSRHFRASPLTNKRSKLDTLALVTEPFYDAVRRPFPPGRTRSIERLPGDSLTGDHGNHRQLVCHGNRVPTQRNRMIRTKLEGERNAKRKVNAGPRGDMLAFADGAKHERFRLEEQGSNVRDRGSRFIDQIEILTKARGGDGAGKPKSVRFDLPDLAGEPNAELTRSTEAGLQTRGEGREARASLESLESGGRFGAEGTPLVKPCTSRKRSDGSRRRRLDTKEASVQSRTRKTTQHGTSVNILMVKFILHPTRHAKVHPDEVTSVKGPLRKKEEATTKKKGWKETHKKGKPTRKPPVSQSIATTGGRQQAQRLKRPKKRPSESSQNEPFRQSIPDKSDGVRGGNGGLCTILETASGVWSPMSPTPVIATESRELPPSVKSPLSISTTAPAESAPSVGPNATRNKMPSHTAALMVATHKAAPPLASPTDAPLQCPPVPRTSADDHEAKEKVVELKPSAVDPSQPEGVTASGDSKAVKVPGHPRLGQASGVMPPDEQEAGDIPAGCDKPNQERQREGDRQPAPGGRRDDEGQTIKEQSEDRGSISKAEMKESEANSKVRHTEGKGPPSTSAAAEASASDNDRETGPGHASQPVGAFSDEAAPRGANGTHGRREEGAAKPADEISHRPRSTEQRLSLLPASSAGTAPGNQGQVDGESVTSERPNRNGRRANSPSCCTPPRRPGASEEPDSNIIILTYQKPGEGMVTGEPRPADCSLLPIHSLGMWDRVGDESNQRRKIRLVIPEQPSSESKNADNRKIR